MSEMNFTDYLIISMTVISIIVGLCRGFVKEIFSISTWGLAIYIAYVAGSSLGNVFSSIETEMIRKVIGSGIIFFSILIIGGFLGHIFSKVVKCTGLSLVDKSLGSILGFARAALVVVFLTPLLAATSSQEDWWKESVLIPKAQSVANRIIARIPDKWKKSVHDQLEIK